VLSEDRVDHLDHESLLGFRQLTDGVDLLLKA
jgi:hypothetical protein